MMRLLVLESARWTVTAAQHRKPSGEYGCPLLESFEGLGQNYEKSLVGLQVMLEKFSEHGPRMLNDGICHEIDEKDKLFEFIKGDLRLIWFYGDGSKIIICSHCFIKKGQKTSKADKAEAKRVKQKYETLRSRDKSVPLYYEDEDFI